MVTEDKPATINDPSDLVKDLGIEWVDLGQWDITRLSLNDKGTTVYFKPKNKFKLRAASTDGWKAPAPALKKTGERLIVIVGDQHAPHHDVNLHRLFCEWLKDNKPDEGISLGDLGDYASISRHPSDPENDAEVQECLDGSYELLRGYRTASLPTRWKILEGNHDFRLRQMILTMAKSVYGIKPAAIDDIEQYGALSLRNLLHLDDLQFEYIDPRGNWEQGKVAITPKLMVKHGHTISQGSGKTALSALEKCRYNVIHGHTHRLGIVHKTSYDMGGEPNVQIAAESGCMCKLDKELSGKGKVWPNYTENHDWTQGFVTVRTFGPNSEFFKLDTAVYINKKLIWGDKIYE